MYHLPSAGTENCKCAINHIGRPWHWPSTTASVSEMLVSATWHSLGLLGAGKMSVGRQGKGALDLGRAEKGQEGSVLEKERGGTSV